MSTYLSLPGEAGNKATSPDTPALSITGDIDLRWRVALNDYTPASGSTLIAKYRTGTNQASYYHQFVTTGVLRLTWSPDGTAGSAIFADSTVATGFVDGSIHWGRVTLDVDNDASGHDVEFFTSDDGIIWTQLGDTVTTAGITSIHDSTEQLDIGAQVTFNLMAGEFYRAQIYDGIDGTLEFDADFSAEAKGTTSFTESSSNAATVTINQNGDPQAEIVQRDNYIIRYVDPATTLQASSALAAEFVFAVDTPNSLITVIGEPILPNTVTDLSVASNTHTSVTLNWTEVDDGTGGASNYAVRYTIPPFDWGSGTESVFLGTGTGNTAVHVVSGLSASTAYEFQLISYRGTLNVDAIFGGFSNKVIETTDVQPPGGGDHPNEPVGFTALIENNFTVLAPTGWVIFNNDSNAHSAGTEITVEQDVGAPFSPPNIYSRNVPAGLEAGSGNAQIAIPGSSGILDHSELYFHFWIKLSSNWDGHESATNKICFLTTQDGSSIVFAARGQGSGTHHFSIGTQDPGPETTHYTWNDDQSNATNLVSPTSAQADIPFGTWTEIEVHFIGNTSGNADGKLNAWMGGASGVQTFKFEGREFIDVGAPNFRGFNLFFIWGGNGGPPVSEDMEMQLSHIYISGTD